ncbi:MAG: hypothetical protein J6X18_17445 [Bacteroidales bacterium]|nr:hypothetical protein [Bacteroidales bacterium]
MRKILFNDKYGLTTAVLNGRKTMTRRIIPNVETEGGLVPVSFWNGKWCGAHGTPLKRQPYGVGEVIAIAQSYETLANSGTEQLSKMLANSSTFKKEYAGAGWNNKMFVRAEYMPHHIRIIDIKVERLQDIIDNDCIAEGIKCFPSDVMPDLYTFEGVSENWKTAREAFAHLIDKVSGKGTWESNPWVFVYSFELID